ncbi:MAG: ECF-type sigma factor [Gemmatales bacterium]
MDSSPGESNESRIKRFIVEHYEDLHDIAMQEAARERPDNSLQASAVINEVVVKLMGNGDPVCFQDAKHFLATARLMMRHLYIDKGRREQAEIHGGELIRKPLNEHVPDNGTPKAFLQLIHEELEHLRKQSPQNAQVIELRAMGFSMEEIAKLLDVSRTEAYNLYYFAKAWILTALKKEE